VLQKILLHHRSILSASARKNSLKYGFVVIIVTTGKTFNKHYVITEKHRIAKYRSRKLKRKVSK